MDLNPYVVLGSAVVGLLVGLTGAGGGALMTPMLILLFNVKPSAAISSDLVAAVVMRPVGSLVHMRRGTVNYRLVGWMCAGSVPMAFLGSYLLHLLGGGVRRSSRTSSTRSAPRCSPARRRCCCATWLDRRSGQARTQAIAAVRVRPLVTIAIGAVGGIVVGMTSVGSGSLMIVLLLFTYPALAAGQLVGTDLTQAVPLTAAAALGALLFGHVQFGLTTARHHRLGARGARRLAAVLAGAGPVHQAGHHLRDLRLRAQVRGPGHDGARLDAVPGAAGVRRLLAGAEQALARQRGRRSRRRRPHRRIATWCRPASRAHVVSVSRHVGHSGPRKSTETGTQ